MKTLALGQSALRKGRWSCSQQIYFITAVTQQRFKAFANPCIARHMSRLVYTGQLLESACCLCWIVMPDHIHLLIELKNMSLPREMNRFKSKSAIALNQLMNRSGRFWAKSFYDHAVRSDESVRDIARYMIYNPVRAGLVSRPGDYPYWHAVWL